MKTSSTNGPNRNICYSAVDKLKAVKLYLEDGYSVQQVAEQFHVADLSKASITASVNFKYIPDILSFLFEKTFSLCYFTVTDRIGYHVVSDCLSVS